jgi:Acetyltransferase (GNAT) domain
MNIFLDNYSYNNNEKLFALFTLTGGALVKRHWHASMKVDCTVSKWTHRTIALIEAIPLLGGISALIEIIAAHYFDSPQKKRSTPKESDNNIASQLELNKKIDFLSRSVKFDENFRRIATFDIVNDNRETSFDLREICHDAETLCTYYAPFQLFRHGEGQIFTYSSNGGWLMLKPYDAAGTIEICRIDNFSYDFDYSKKMRGIGSALVQFAIEKSIEMGYGGKVSVNSTNRSALFYHKLGFVCVENPQMQKRILEAALSNEKGLDGGNMQLSEDSIVVWKKKISKNPILSKSVSI